jgi:hypothetical protein
VLASQRTPENFRNAKIKTDRALRKDPGYEPQFLNTPLTVSEIAVELDDGELAVLRGYEFRALYGDDLGATLRDLFFSWWEGRFVTSPNGAPNVTGAPPTSTSTTADRSSR